MRWLRWLRDATLAMILAAGLLCLLVTYQAHREITVAAGRGASAITDAAAASAALARANTAVAESFDTGDDLRATANVLRRLRHHVGRPERHI